MTDGDTAEPEAASVDTAGAAERAAKLASLRAQKGPPVQGARILTAGISGSLLLGLMAWMGWADQVASTSPAMTAAPATTIVPTAPTTLTAPTPTAPPLALDTVAPADTAAMTSPTTVAPPVAAPIEIPLATPPHTTVPSNVAPPVATTQPSS